MNKKPLFSQIIFVVLLAAGCIAITVAIAFLAGSINTDIFDFQNINFSNMIPVLFIGGFISCVIVGISILYVARTVFDKAKKYLDENEKKTGGQTK